MCRYASCVSLTPCGLEQTGYRPQSKARGLHRSLSMSQATLHLDAEQEAADAEQELANWQTAKNSQTIAALDLPSLPQRLSLNHGLVVDSERIVSALDLAGVDEARRMLTKSARLIPDGNDRDVVHCSDFDCHSKTRRYYVRALLRPEGATRWELVDAGRRRRRTAAAAAAGPSDAAAAPATRIARRRLVDTPVCYYQAVVLPPKG